MSQVARIDKWLWAARIFKTRSIAIDACKNGRVTIDGARTKPSHLVKAGDIISVRNPPITYPFKIKQAIERRVGAKLIPEILENITSPEQYELLEMSKISGFINRAKSNQPPGWTLQTFVQENAAISVFFTNKFCSPSTP